MYLNMYAFLILFDHFWTMCVPRFVSLIKGAKGIHGA